MTTELIKGLIDNKIPEQASDEELDFGKQFAEYQPFAQGFFSGCKTTEPIAKKEALTDLLIFIINYKPTIEEIKEWINSFIQEL